MQRRTQSPPRKSRSLRHRRGAALVLAVALMFVLFSFLAFSIDTGYVAQTRAEMRRTADAAALAGCWELYSSMEGGQSAEDAHSTVRSVSRNFAALNPVCRTAPEIDSSDTEIGYIDSLRGGTITSDSSQPYYAVQVTVTRNTEKNGQVPYFFGRIFGSTGRDMVAQATAVMGREVSGFSTPPTSATTLNLLPFTLDVETWDDLMAGGGSDNYSFDGTSIGSGSDGVREVNLYPQGTGSPGNRGTVDLGGSNNSTNDIARQILNGISRQDLLDLGKPLALNDAGYLTLNGDTGISAGVKDELASIVGETRVIPLFSSVSGNGNNANYTIVRWVGVRILDVQLTGPMSKKSVMIQPANVISPYGIRSTAATSSSDFVLTPVMLAQ